MKKRLLAILLTVCMVISMAPAALAADEDAAPDMTGTIVNVTAANAQDVLDGKYGNINGKTINFTENITDVLDLARPTGYAGSNTYYEGYNGDGTHATKALITEGTNLSTISAASIYYRTLSNVTFTADAGVTVAGFTFAADHKVGPAHDYVRDADVESGDAYYDRRSLDNITFKGLTITGQFTALLYEDATVSNVTFDGCTFTGTTDDNENAAIKFLADSQYFTNIAVKDCKISGYYQGVYISGVDSATIKGNTISGTKHNAIALQSADVANPNTLKGTVAVEENYISGAENRAIRLNAVSATAVISVNNNIMVNCGDEEGQLIKAGTISEGAAIDLESNYWDGKSTAVDSSLTAPTTVGITSWSNTTADVELKDDYVAEGYKLEGDEIVVDAGAAVAKIGDSYYLTLSAAVAAAQNGDTITLLKDVNLTEKITVNKGVTITAGSAVTITTAVEAALTAGTGGKLTLGENITVTITDITSDANKAVTPVYADGGTLVVDGATIYAGVDAAAIWAVKNNGSTSKVEVNSGKIEAGGILVAFEGAQVDIKGGELKSGKKWSGIGANGAGAIINITGGTIAVAADNAIKAESGGKIVISGGTVETTNPDLAAIVAYTTGTVEITGGTIKGSFSKADSGTISISGGSFTVKPSDSYLAAGYTTTNIGTEESPEYVLTIDTDETTPLTAVAEIVGGGKYATLEMAIANAQNGNTVTLLADIALSGEEMVVIPASKTVTLNMAGYDITGAADQYALDVYGKLILTGTADSIVTGGICINDANSEVVMDTVTVQTLATDLDGMYNVLNYGGKFTMNSGKLYVASDEGSLLLALWSYGGTTQISGGEIVSDDTHNKAGDDANYAVLATDSANITLANVRVTGAGGGVCANSSATVTINSGNITAGLFHSAYAGTGSININGGTFNSTSGYATLAETSGTITVKGGTFDTDPVSYVASGYCVKDNNTTYTVAAHSAGPDDGDCTTAVTCPHCGEEATAAKAHDWSNKDGECANEGCDVICNEAHAAGTTCATCGKVTPAPYIPVAPTTYSVTVEDVQNGDVTVSPSYASPGSTVTITVDPDVGYKLSDLTVLDKNGKEIELTAKGNGEYTFKMPSGKVTVEATFVEAVTENPFVDVAENAYYYDAVLWAVNNGITNGTSATTFSPDAVCTRAQVVTFLWRAAGCPEPVGAANEFADVDSNAYYAKAVQWAVEQGITLGTGDNKFSPDAECTRGQIVTFLWRSQGSENATANNPFVDVADGAYYEDAVLWAVEEAITNGTGADTFSPDADCTRGQIVTFLWRCLTK